MKSFEKRRLLSSSESTNRPNLFVIERNFFFLLSVENLVLQFFTISFEGIRAEKSCRRKSNVKPAVTETAVFSSLCDTSKSPA